MKPHVVRLGSSRTITAIESGRVRFKYETWSAGDRGRNEQFIPGMNEARCACAVKTFELAKAAGIPTHFIEQVSETEFDVYEFGIPGLQSLSGKLHGTIIPLEWLRRTHVKGSLRERLLDGRMRPEEVGLPAHVEIVDGMPLPRMRIECTTKYEAIDRHVSNEEARVLAGLSGNDWDRVVCTFIRFVDVTGRQYASSGFMSPDGKNEFALANGSDVFPDGTVVMVDVGGTPDEDRILDLETGDIHSKDLIRDYLAKIGYKAELEAAKKMYPKDKKKWPPYPILPPPIVDLVSERYAAVAHRYAEANITR